MSKAVCYNGQKKKIWKILRMTSRRFKRHRFCSLKSIFLEQIANLILDLIILNKMT